MGLIMRQLKPTVNANSQDSHIHINHSTPLAFLFKGYTHSEMAEITGYSTRFLSKLASQGNPAWTHKRWWLIPFTIWLLNPKTQKKRGRKPTINLEDDSTVQAKIDLTNVINMFAGGI